MVKQHRSSRLRLAPLALPVTLVATTALAGDPPEEFDPDAYHDQIMEKAAEDAELYDSLYLATPEWVYDQMEPEPEPFNPSPAVVFINMDGATMNCTSNYQDDSKTNTSWVCGSYAGPGQMNYAAYNGNKQALMDAAKADWQPFNVNLVDSRPNSGNYTMCMTGPTNFIGGGVLGVAPLDCFDNVKNNVVYAFVGGQHSIDTAATTISQEVAHAYGLEHVTGTADIMYPSVQVNQSFKDQCYSITQGGQCGSQHAQNCGGGQQNSYQDLMKLFGPSMPDTADPMVNITSPTDGEVFMAGADFTITVNATDDVEVASVELFVNDQSAGSLSSAPYEWPANGIPEGTHEFYAVATDGWGNEAISAVVTVEATADGTTTGGGSGGTGGDGDGDGDGDSGGSGGSGGADTGGDPYPGDAFPPGFGSEDSESGCGCSTARNDLPAGAALMLLAIGAPLLRRRR